MGQAYIICRSFLRAVESSVIYFPGYYYELDDSYDESDEEEVRAHLRRVAEQPPLKLDDSAEVNRHSLMHYYYSYQIFVNIVALCRFLMIPSLTRMTLSQ